MVSEGFSRRFNGSARLYGADILQRLSLSHICIAGLGGVGSWAAEALARTGIGKLTLIDLDDICISNTNRQIHTTQETIGKSKCDVMASRIESINPECRVHVINDFLDEENIGLLVPDDSDYVFDAIDSFRVKSALIAYCKKNNKNIIVAGSAGGKKNPTKIQVSDLGKTVQDPMARKIRDHLKKYYGFKRNKNNRFGIDYVFSSEAIQYPQADGSICARKPETMESVKMDCATGLGASTVVTASFGFVAAAHIMEKMAIKI